MRVFLFEARIRYQRHTDMPAPMELSVDCILLLSVRRIVPETELSFEPAKQNTTGTVDRFFPARIPPSSTSHSSLSFLL